MDVDDSQDQTLRSLLSDEEKYKTAEPLELKCFACGAVSKYESPVTITEGNTLPRNGLMCSKCRSEYPIAYIQNTLTLRIRYYVNQYYRREKKCGLHHVPDRNVT